MHDARQRRPLAHVGRYFVHILVGTLLFVGISGAAVLLANWVEKLKEWGMPEFMVKGCLGAEYLVFGADLMLFGMFVVTESVFLGRDLVYARSR